ncbi:hypothetical protein [Aestuariimicrobium sp. T2.26MG-19.2B]|uniref:hypothetical protein n=1 Tax=Aestuariimicrobium sp. T2.26MG-19.2B TaxID=3040679 RepID=UPI002477513A|nr:hypothetical protein [Aestuariimicrobium sp. T2.26MG-19.2B]CAI9410684.1 hypothetical protein AESSP_02490 [Aestuariimicrobium sp. T2.26MG-19.2B]
MTADPPVLLTGDLVHDGGWRLIDDVGRIWHLGDLDATLVSTLRRCTGTDGAVALAATLPAHRRDEWLDLCGALASAGALHTQPRPRTVAVIGSGRLAQEFCLATCRQAGTTLVLVDVSAPDRGLYPRSRDSTGAGALHQWLRSRVDSPRTLVVGGHWADLTAEGVDVAVVVTPTVLPDRAVTDHLQRSGLTHLIVTQHRAAAHVGPMVVPGRGPCLCCDDIVKAAGDPRWPTTVATLSRTRASTDEAMVGWAARQASLLVGAVTSAGAPRSPQALPPAGDGVDTATVWSASSTAGPWCRQWLAHPDCPCQTALPVTGSVSVD